MTADCLLPHLLGRATGRGDADARLHDRSRHGRARLWAQARHRRRRHASARASIPSGAMISQTSGHGDFRFRSSSTVAWRPAEPLGGAKASHAIADSPDEVRLRAREQLRQGASQIKLMAGGGVARLQSDRIDPVHRARDPRRRGGCRKLGNLRRRARLHAARDPAGDRRRRQVHRARSTDRRADRGAHGREGHLVEPAAADLRCGGHSRG